MKYSRIKFKEDFKVMTDFEKRIKTRLIEDEYAKKFHALEMEESIAHINHDNNQLREINEKRVHLELQMELEKRVLDY